MKKIITMTLLSIIFTVGAAQVLAYTRVKGYTKGNGTYVAPHYKSNSNSYKYDNWSTSGNSNPFTGKKGYRQNMKNIISIISVCVIFLVTYGFYQRNINSRVEYVTAHDLTKGEGLVNVTDKIEQMINDGYQVAKFWNDNSYIPAVTSDDATIDFYGRFKASKGDDSLSSNDEFAQAYVYCSSDNIGNYVSEIASKHSVNYFYKDNAENVKNDPEADIGYNEYISAVKKNVVNCVTVHHYGLANITVMSYGYSQSWLKSIFYYKNDQGVKFNFVN